MNYSFISLFISQNIISIFYNFNFSIHHDSNSSIPASYPTISKNNRQTTCIPNWTLTISSIRFIHHVLTINSPQCHHRLKHKYFHCYLYIYCHQVPLSIIDHVIPNRYLLIKYRLWQLHVYSYSYSLTITQLQFTRLLLQFTNYCYTYSLLGYSTFGWHAVTKEQVPFRSLLLYHLLIDDTMFRFITYFSLNLLFLKHHLLLLPNLNLIFHLILSSPYIWYLTRAHN